MMDRDALLAEFQDPPREFGMMPFWFWNDDLDENEIRRQIREFHAKGFGGFIPHARIGLSRRVGYLTDEYFRFMRVAAAEAKRLGMYIVLYDEGSYPSGSAQGRVVAENPDYAARCLIPITHKIEGPARGYWRPNPGRAMKDRLLHAVLARETSDDTLDPDSFMLLDPLDHDVLHYDVPDGAWRIVTVWNVFSGGIIRGVFDEEDDNHALAPAAGNIMDADSVACFLRHTHDQYYERLSEYFGSTIVGMFTDEPNPLGRATRRGPRPHAYTDGLLDELRDEWGDEVDTCLPALWFDCGRDTKAFREAYHRAVKGRIERVFYAAQSEWCEQHGIALTGHPEQSDEMGALRYFQWPGQDMVWRYVEPNADSALEGRHSVAAKAASSAASVAERRRSASELFGAYGWHLTLDEAKWLLDWHLVRGNNLFFSHAAFYSIRGRRAFESEPDISVHNVWWTHFGLLGDYTRRVCWAMTDGAHVCDVAVLTEANVIGWRAAAELLTSQLDFVYVDGEALQRATVTDGRLSIGQHEFGVVVVDSDYTASAEDLDALAAFALAGGVVVREWDAGDLGADVRRLHEPDVVWDGPSDLRVRHYRKDEADWYLLVNEGEDTLDGTITLSARGELESWNPLTGDARPWGAVEQGAGIVTCIRLYRRESMLLRVAGGEPTADVPPVSVPGAAVATLAEGWTVHNDDDVASDAPPLGDWSQTSGLGTFSGTLRYGVEFELSEAHVDAARFLDLGRVGDIAEAFVNGQRVGVAAWAPYTLPLDAPLIAGANRLEVHVTNSMANEFDGRQKPSGLMGPVRLLGGHAGHE
ncbi:hypothetical protein HN766_08935 [Candidatus Poribacteria bacterium]|nr:hypothetical protein [Candidatus Poribacteria bacterium]